MNKVETPPSSYASAQNRQAVAWKHRSPVLPHDARRAGYYHGDRGPYPVCLPAEHASHNLLPEIREGAIALFGEVDIPWHDGVGNAPNNHLRDSQVQCCNALFAMVADAGRIKLAYGDAVDIAEVLPMEDDRFLTFEYIGPTDYFGEGFRGGRDVGRRRGTNCTSVDAAFLYKTSAGATELAMVEWKFTESYPDAKERSATSDAVRVGRYAADLGATDSPIDLSDLAMELLLDEPFYQLMRQQRLDKRLEQDRVLDADVVRVLHVLAPENVGYQDSPVRVEHRALGSTVEEVWAKLLRSPDRFVHIDPQVFLDPAVTSAEYVDRYSPAPARHSPLEANGRARPHASSSVGCTIREGHSMTNAFDEPSWSPWSTDGEVEPFAPTLARRFAALTPFGSLSLRHPLLEPYFGSHEGMLVLTWLTRGGCEDLATVLSLTEDAILDWPQIGHGKLQRILELLSKVAADAASLGDLLIGAHGALAHQSDPGSVQLVDDLDVLAQWGDFAARADTWGAVETTLDRPMLPADVAASAERVRALPTGLAAQQDPGDVLLEWIDALDDRDRHIFESRLVRVKPETLDAIGQAYDVTRERVRQLEVKLTKRARSLYEQDPAWRHVRWAGFLLEEELGAYAPRSVVDTRAADGEQRFDRWLLLWFAGISVTDTSFRRLGWTLPGIDEVPFREDSWVVDRAALDADLLARGVREDFLDFAIDSIKGLSRVDDSVVRWGTSVIDRACALLAVHGQPMEVSELHDVLGGSERSLRGRLFDDPRVTRVSRHSVGLSTWGGEAYDGVVNAMMRRLEQHGEVVLTDLAAELASQFGVSANSVTMYSAAPVFRTVAGKIRLRESPESFVPRAEPHRVQGLFQPSAHVLRWNVTVDKDLKRGSGRALPTEVGTFFGVTPGVHITVHGPVKDIPIGWAETSHTGPSIGSLKAYADELGAQIGDVLQLRFDRDRSMQAIVREPSPVETIPSARLAWLTGMSETVTNDVAALAAAVHVPVSELEPTLRGRGDEAVADAVVELLEG